MGRTAAAARPRPAERVPARLPQREEAPRAPDARDTEDADASVLPRYLGRRSLRGDGLEPLGPLRPLRAETPPSPESLLEPMPRGDGLQRFERLRRMPVVPRAGAEPPPPAPARDPARPLPPAPNAAPVEAETPAALARFATTQAAHQPPAPVVPPPPPEHIPRDAATVTAALATQAPAPPPPAPAAPEARGAPDPAAAAGGPQGGPQQGRGTVAPGAQGPAARGGGGGGGGGGAGGPDLGEEEGEEGQGALPDAVTEEADAPVEAPPLAWQDVDSSWNAPGEIAVDQLLPPPPHAGPAARPPAPGGGKGDKGGAPAPTDPGADAEDKRRSEREAAALAQRAYGDLARSVRREQDGFVGRANQVTHYMAQAYGLEAGQIVQRHDTDRSAIDQVADAAAAEIENAGALMQMSVEASARATGRAIERAGRSAYGMINAGERGGVSQIAAVVSGLVAGHVGAYNDAITRADRTHEDARTKLTQFSDERATRYSSLRGAWLERAKNEKRQIRIPHWVEPEAKGLQERFERKKTAWEGSRDNTSCSLSCSYREALAAENARMAVQGRCAVASALREARRTLAQQARQAQQAIAQITKAQVQQVRVQQRTAKSRLNSQARSALAGVRQEAQQAVGGLQAAARGALPTYLRAAQGFAQNLRTTAPRGARALKLAAERGPEGTLQGVERSTEQLDERLRGNQQKLDTSLAGQREAQLERSQQEAASLQGALETLRTQTTEQLDQSAAGFLEAFDGLAGTVSAAASSWAQPLQARMAAFIAGKRTEADTALASLRSGQPPPAAAPAPPPPADTSCPTPAAAASSCSSCAQSTGNAGTGTATGTGDGANAPGLDQQVLDEETFNNQRANPEQHYSAQLETAGADAQTALETRANNVVAALGGGFAGTVDEAGVLAALRGMTLNQGRALDTQIYPRRHGGRQLDTDLQRKLGADSTDYEAASAYLWGDNVTGANLELRDSMGVFNDDEARIEAVMRSLSPDDLAALGQAHGDTLNDVHAALDGTDQQVFDALRTGDAAAADAYRMRDAVDEARRDGNADAVHSAIERYTGAPAEGDWRATQEMDADARRAAVVQALGNMVTDADVARGAEPGADVAHMSAEDRAVAYVSRDIDVYVGGGPEGEGQTVTMRLEGANRDLAGALLRHGETSIEARAARLGVEMQRRGDPPNAINIDRATFDPRFSADLTHATPAEREAHRRAAEDRARVVMLAAERYAGGTPTPNDYAPANDPNDPGAAMSDTRVTAARDRLIAGLGERFGANSTGAQLAAGLLTDARPTADTAALAMRHAMEGAGTNEDLLFRFTERMNRDEIAAMRGAYRRQTGNSLDADLGTFGEGFLGEVSGDDRLRMERALLGQPRNDAERLEVAAFAIEQQRRESSGFGAWLADGTLAEEAMTATEGELRVLAGGPIGFGERGRVIGVASSPNFDAQGRYIGRDHDTFAATTATAQAIAETYSHRIDAFADIATTGIAILGAIAAAVITVATGGAAAPLIAAALITGLASMGANYAIKGGRYGWEQAAVDLGMTAVQAITAGVGAQLGAAAQVASKGAAAASTASRTLASLSRLFTGNPVVDQIIIGAVTGSIGGVAGAAFDERTWEHGGGDAAMALFGGLIKGGLSGAATATLTQSIEALGRNGAAIADRARAFAAQGGLARGAVGLAGRGLGAVGRGIGGALNASTERGGFSAAGAMAARGLARGTISGLGGMAGRATELGTQALGEVIVHGHARGDAGDALLDIGHAGLHSFVQGIGEGAGEAVGQSIHAQHHAEAVAAINRERAERGLRPLPPGNELNGMADDLMFLNQHGRHGGDALGRFINVDHIVTHGGLEAIATTHPVPAVEEHMRAQLLRHVPEEARAALADVPVRVLPEAEYHALTRSESGPVVTLVQDGHPVVMIREGTPLARLADEGPHLLQAREASTRARVARLDEAVLAHWDALPVEAQIDLYRNKVELEIDAHERVARSLEQEATREGADPARLAADMERNEGTLRNLRQRLQEVGDITPARRAAMEEGGEPRPQYLEQPARLFSKESMRRSTSEEIAEVMRQTIAEHETRIAPRAGAEEEPHPTAPQEPPPGAEGRPHFDRTPDQDAEAAGRLDRGNTFNNEEELRLSNRHPAGDDAVGARHEVYIDTPGGGRVRADSYIPGEEIVSRKYSQLAELGEEGAIAYINELLEKYPPGATLSDVPSNQALRDAGETVLRAQRMVLTVPEQHAPIPMAVLEHAQRAGVIIRDPEGRLYTPERPDGGGRGGPRASARDPDLHAEAMREALLRHVPPELHDVVGDTPITVLRDRDFVQLTGSERGRAVVLITERGPMVVVREGTPVARLSDEGPHLVQAHEAATRQRVAQHDESVMRDWHTLPLERQVELYRNKVALEIDAHERIARSLEAESPQGRAAAARHLHDVERNEATLAALRARQAEVEGLTPQRRAAIEGGVEERPQYLDQPARLFSKEGGVRSVFEPFSGPSLTSAHDLQARYPNAQVTAAEATAPPSPLDAAAFHAVGGRVLQERFGESLPDNSVDRMHVRFPLPHEKTASDVTMELTPALLALPPAQMTQEILRIQAAHEGAIESVTNLGPHALRTLSPGGEIEIVYDESQIGHEVTALAGHTWRDPQTGTEYRLEPVGPTVLRPKSEVAPYSGEHGLEHLGPHDDVHVARLRKVAVPGTEPGSGGGGGGGRRPSMTDDEVREAREGRSMRKHQEREAQRARVAAREQAQEREAQQAQARQARDASVQEEVAQRRRAVEEGRVSAADDFHQRVAEVAAQIDMPAHALARAVHGFLEDLGGSGRRLNAQDVIDSLRNRIREGRPPRFGDLEGLVADLALEQNAEAVAQMREHLLRNPPDAVLGVQRGGAFLAEMLAQGVPAFPEVVQAPKYTLSRPGQRDAELRTPHLEVEMLQRIAAGQRRFAIVDFYMGGVFAEELLPMLRRVLTAHPDVSIDVMWMRETHGFERLVFHPELENRPGRPRRNPLIPTREELERGVLFSLARRNGQPVLEGPGVVMPQLQGADPSLAGLRTHEFPVELVLGDDMRIVMDRSPSAPITVFDRNGGILRTIRPGEPDPLSGLPLDHNTRQVLLRLIEERIRAQAAQRSMP